MIGTISNPSAPRQISILLAADWGLGRGDIWAVGYLSQTFTSKINSFTSPVQIQINRSIHPVLYNPKLLLPLKNKFH